jgi:glycosyltransferase involved in cell wall biosynthesis
MRLGLIARADNSGLGVQTWEFGRHMRPDKTLVIDVGHLHNPTEHCNKATFRDRHSNATYHRDWTPDAQLLRRFLHGLDVVFTAETPYNMELFKLARSMGVRTVLQYNFEFLPYLAQPYLPAPDMFAAPSMWRWDDVPLANKTFLPVPIATDRFDRRPFNSGQRHFLHVVGRPAVFDRNGTPDVLGALRHVKSDIRLTLKCQDANYLSQLRMSAHVPPNVELITDSTDVPNYWDNYSAGDVMILPRRYGGLCLPANEAIGAGMPVIMTDISPNNQWLPAEWLVPASKTAEFMAFNHIDVYVANHVALAAKIDQFASDEDFYSTAVECVTDLAKEYSWQNLRDDYEKVLSGK